MKYAITAHMRPNGAIGLFYARSVGFECDETNPEAIKYAGIVAANANGQEVGHGPVYVTNASGDYVYPLGLEASKGVE